MREIKLFVCLLALSFISLTIQGQELRPVIRGSAEAFSVSDFDDMLRWEASNPDAVNSMPIKKPNPERPRPLFEVSM